ncbi:MAG: F0F1 ATP synthase subunit delta [Kiritimatiellae bacterium]|nr:F0F1 ATP synthase subunit delta [Kiritimatiellia bacterium]
MENIVRVLMPLVPIAVVHVVVLAVILFLIKKMLLGDTMRAVAKVRQVETEVRKKEETIRNEIQEHEKEFVKKRADAQEELQREREASEAEVTKMRDSTLAEARTEGEKIIEQAKKDEERLREQIAREMEEKAIDYGGQVFKLVFSEKITTDLNKSFIAELLDALEEVDAGSITVDSSEAEFASSHPIDPEQKSRLEKLLADKFGAEVKVQEKVQPELLAGLVFKLGSLEIDGSLLNRYQEAAAEVKKTAQI